jgi:hypothetical protein
MDHFLPIRNDRGHRLTPQVLLYRPSISIFKSMPWPLEYRSSYGTNVTQGDRGDEVDNAMKLLIE